MLAGMQSMFAWIPNLNFEPKSIEQIQAELDEKLGNPNMKDSQALRSDWQAVGRDMKSVMPIMGLKS